MKTSKIILIGVAIIILVSFVIFVVIMKKTVQSIHEKAESGLTYKRVNVDGFEKLDLSSRLVVHIWQGKQCQVEYATESDSDLKPRIENLNGTLHFSIDSIANKDSSAVAHLKIIMSSLHEIKAMEATEINLGNFQSDSLHIILENECAFNGNNNQLKHLSIETSGKTMLHFTTTLP